MNDQPDPTALPPRVSSAAHEAAELLFAALGPDMSARPRPEIEALWFAAKLLAAAAGDLDFPDKPVDEQRRERWEEVASSAAYITDKALTVAAEGLSMERASDRLGNLDAIEQEVATTARAYAGVVELTPPDFTDTGRLLTVAIRADLRRTIRVTASRGVNPMPRQHTAATLLRTSHHLHQLGRALGELVLEPVADGIPMCGPAGHEVTCQICARIVGADVARTIEVATPLSRKLTVCSTTCARAANAGEYAETDHR
ncbi:hypothetical protein SAMN05421812_12820 [Asanoa hainanensis]|uniref:Uncharacterized protein n=1 Tax=Asanoa hainanensis TaxID=560556 RepID=A0A239PH20_9ACTN|nr:hypothetical protein [Asanoa hainanensis]SNT65874.1 hypothetical protein SAMN05421812_12820 [Asanoa hainanensis]